MSVAVEDDSPIRSSLCEYLERFSPLTLSRLYSHPVNTLFIFRILPPLAQYVILRLLWIKGPTPFSELRSWHPAIHKSLQNKALWRLKQLYILQGKEQQVWLASSFQEELQKALSGKYTGFTECRNNQVKCRIQKWHIVDANVTISPELLEEHAKSKWEGVLYELVSGSSSLDYLKGPSSASARVAEMLAHAQLILESTSGYTITNKGFQFLLNDRHAQVWAFLLQYLEVSEANGTDSVEMLSIIFQLGFTKSGKAYSVKDLNEEQEQIIRQLSEYGLVYIEGALFYPTRLSSMLSSESSSSQSQLSPEKPLGFIIVETNYRVYAYTSSPLDIALLNLFMRTRDRFPNMILGQLTQESVQAAYARGITAAQLTAYLCANAHDEMIRRRTTTGSAPSSHSTLLSNAGILAPTIVDQLALWEFDRKRLKLASGYLYQQFLNASDWEQAREEARSIRAELYAHPTKRILVVSTEGHSHIKNFIKNKLK